jgi:MFS-type transporter involved in bile tolerance (Atg22 family)
VNIQNPSLIPWAWAVNGCSTVVGAILTAVLSMNFGFNAVLVASIVVYIAAFAVLEN